ncbi:MAG: cyclic pyranopterin monophosphate synthase MoaC [Solirubrobacteraceae bacterium]|nr:cyclic pyranopterin monophosphate synthase MoaC [Solirubrobacteraceae bacterium]
MTSAATITITLRLFAQVRRSAGVSTVERAVPAGTRAGELAATVLEELGLEGLAGSIVLAVNGDFSDPDVVLRDGEWLSMVPPVSGGAPDADGPTLAPGLVDVRITEEPLGADAALAAVSSRAAGGTVLFQGTPRDVDALEFEAHAELAERELRRIGASLLERHGLTAIALHHRLGLVPVGENAILIAAASPHRGPAFAAAAEALDEIKSRVPIWKAEVVGDARAPVEGEVVSGVRTVAEAAAGDDIVSEPPVAVAVAATAGPTAVGDPAPTLTHVDADGAARMVDVSDKAITDRTARAVATVRVSPRTAHLVATGSGPKGEVLATARLAGIMAAKRAAELVPLAHPLPLTKVDVSASVDEEAGLVHLEGFARTTGKTGVEIEALTAVLVAALVVYDMVKAVEQHAIIDDVRVVEKAGGRRDFKVDRPALASPPKDGEEAASHAPTRRPLAIAAIHVSTSRTAGTRPDAARPALAAFAERTGWTVVHETMVADDRAAIAEAIRDAASGPGVEAVFTLGGTGVTSDDVTPEATGDVIERTIDGLAEALRAASLAITPMAALSRGIAGILGETVVVNLPGSPKALAELEPLLSAVLPHAAAQARRRPQGD